MDNDSSVTRLVNDLDQLVRRLPAGTRLPSTRQLAADHGVGPVTVQSAIRRLVAGGLVETRPGAGNFVRSARQSTRVDFSWQTTALGPARTERADIGSTMLEASDGAIALHNGYPSEDLLPVRAVRAALSKAARSRSAVERPLIAGLPQLRDWFAAELGAQMAPGGNAPTRSDVIIMPGGQSALSSIFRAIAAPGEAIIMESPTYWGAIAAARQAGLTIVPLARTDGAVAPGDLDDALATTRARLFYAQPNFANPTGASWTRKQAIDTLDVLRARGAFLVEDDWAHDFGIDQPALPVATLDSDGHVLYVRSLTKSVSPSIRVAAVIARGPALTRVQADRTVDDLYVSAVLQEAALDVVSGSGWAGSRRSLADQLRTRRDELARLIDKLMPPGTLSTIPRGALNLWLQLPAGVPSAELVRASAAKGLLVSPGDEWFPAEPAAQFIRLNYSGPDPSRFEEAIRILAAELALLTAG